MIYVEGPVTSIDKETARERQSRVVKSGNEWEKYVKLFLEEKLNGTGIQILWEHEVQKDKEDEIRET